MQHMRYALRVENTQMVSDKRTVAQRGGVSLLPHPVQQCPGVGSSSSSLLQCL